MTGLLAGVPLVSGLHQMDWNVKVLSTVTVYRILSHHICNVYNGNCSHQCVNINGTYTCVCPDQAILTGDRLTCMCYHGYSFTSDGLQCEGMTIINSQ